MFQTEMQVLQLNHCEAYAPLIGIAFLFASRAALLNSFLFSEQSHASIDQFLTCNATKQFIVDMTNFESFLILQYYLIAAYVAA